MNASLLLRGASILTAIHFAGHTFGGMFSSPSHGPLEVATIQAMKLQQFDFMGSMRSYWDFYFGFGLMLGVVLLIQTAQLWLLSTAVRRDAAAVRPLIGSFCVAYLAMAVLAWRYFFIAPVVFEVSIAICLALAFAAAKPTISHDRNASPGATANDSGCH
jgi:hypothetical protein